MSRDILPIREIDYDLLRRELELDPTGRGYGELVAVWRRWRDEALPLMDRPAAQCRIGVLNAAIVALLNAPTLAIGQGSISRATQLGFVGLMPVDVMWAMEMDSR